MQQKPLIIFGIAVAIVTAVFVVGYQNRNQIFSTLRPIGNQLIAVPTPAGPETMIIGEARSMDGTMTLALQRTTNRESGMQTYSFIASGTSSPLFTKTVASRTSMSAPANSWSPDNKYVFIEEQNEQGVKNYLVLKASGEPFANNQQYLDVGELFSAKKLKYTLNEATGWASETLLILTTKELAEGPEKSATKGPSYWFEVPSKAILQLSR